jgi:hypothetical protein
MGSTPDDGTYEDEEDLLGTELRTLLSSLPKDLSPERDLSGEIAARTWDSRERLPGAGRIAAETTKRLYPAPAWWSGQELKLAAAALALIVVTSAVTAVLVQDQFTGLEDAPATVAGASIDGDPTALEASFARDMDGEDQYASAIADLVAALEGDRERIPVETVQLIEENLRIIDEAIQQSLTALESAPQSLFLQQAVMTSYERKLDFLRQAAAITAEG